MNRQLFAILALSSLIIPYQNCSNQIAFESEGLEKVAQIVDEANSQTLESIPENVEDENSLQDPETIEEDEEQEVVENPVVDDKDEHCLGEDCHTNPPTHVDPMPEARCNYMNVFAKVKGTKLKLGSAKIYSAKELSIEENMQYGLNGNKDYSVHPLIGPEIKGKSTKMYLVRSIEGISLNVIFNQYNGGSQRNRVKMKVAVSKNLGRDKVLYIEDADSDTYKNIETPKFNSYDFTFNYYRNTDSFAIGPIDHEESLVHIQAIQMGDAAANSVFYSADGYHIDLFQKEGNGLAQIELLGCQMNTTLDLDKSKVKPPIAEMPEGLDKYRVCKKSDDQDCD
ncbi:MAG: hypothetical protein VX642_09345 [Bdellovibrionota bacterium]|nr:hypothetical protein [Bdellovibrionota bacterium]